MSKIFKIGSAAGGVGTIAGVTATTVLISQRPDLELTREEVKTEASNKIKDFASIFGIVKEKDKDLFEAIKEKTKEFKKGNEIDLSKLFSLIEGMDKEILNKEKLKKAFEELDDKDTKESVEGLESSKLTELVDIEGFKEEDGKNNLCDLIQKEGVRRMIRGGFKYAFKESDDFFFALSTCILTNRD